MIAERQLQLAESQRGQVEQQVEAFVSGWKYDQERWERYMMKLVMSAEFNSAPAMFSVMLRMEVEGGACPECGIPWRKVHTGGKMGGFAYHDPNCTCFPRCGDCGSSHHRGVALGAEAKRFKEGITPCPSCGNAITRITRRLEQKGSPMRLASQAPFQLSLQ